MTSKENTSLSDKIITEYPENFNGVGSSGDILIREDVKEAIRKFIDELDVFNGSQRDKIKKTEVISLIDKIFGDKLI